VREPVLLQMVATGGMGQSALAVVTITANVGGSGMVESVRPVSDSWIRFREPEKCR